MSVRGFPRRSRAIFSLLLPALVLAGCGGTVWSTRADSGSPPRSPVVHPPPLDGESFADPQGKYTMTLGPLWVTRTGLVGASETEAWLIAPADHGFAPNVNVATEPAPGLDLAGYLALSVKQGPQILSQFHAVGVHTITGTYGQALGAVEYTASSSAGPFHFFAVVTLHNGQAVVATLTAPDDASFAALRKQVEPYFDTLRAT